MNDIQVSLFASAVRTKDWLSYYDSLKANKINWEVVFCGNEKPSFALPDNFKWIYANVKPCQCYEIAARACSGELIGWSTDDATYSNPHGTPDTNLDRAYKKYTDLKNEKTIISMRPIEDNRDIWFQHRFFGKWDETPMMAPMGLINRELFMKLGGYDRNFISGQGENDIVMRVLEIGGRVEMAMDAYVYIHHRLLHVGKEHKSMMRQYYVADRMVLENAWVKGGYGAYGQGGMRLRKTELSKTRLKPVESFEDREDIYTVSQGPKGTAEKYWN